MVNGKGADNMVIWQMVLAGLALVVILILVCRGVSRWRWNRREQRRIMNRIYELRQQGYTNEDFYIDTSYGIPVVRLYE